MHTPEPEFDPKYHQLDEDGEHDPDECQPCIEAECSVTSNCRCGQCCGLLVETTVWDAVREPKIAEFGSEILDPPDPTGHRELIGYLLNHVDGRCVFLDPATKGCTIYATRPGVCRIFDCDGDGREQLIELGMIDRTEAERTPSDIDAP